MQHRGNLSLCSGPFASGRQLLLITWCKIFDGSSRFLVLLLKVSVLARLVPEPHNQGFLSFPVSHSVTGNFCLFFSAGWLLLYPHGAQTLPCIGGGVLGVNEVPAFLTAAAASSPLFYNSAKSWALFSICQWKKKNRHEFFVSVF